MILSPELQLAELELAEIEDQEARDSLLAFVQLFSPHYTAGWVHEELCAVCEEFVLAVEEHGNPHAEWDQPPQTGKSQIISRCWPAWTLGRHPDWHWITGCYGQEFANEFGRDVRRIMMSPRYRCIFPQAALGVLGSEDGGSERVDRLTLQRGGSYTAVAAGSAATGRPAHIFSIDDPVKNREDANSETYQQRTLQWYTDVATTRLQPGGGIFLTMTRWNVNDLGGKLRKAEREAKKAGHAHFTWNRFAYPAIAEADEYSQLDGRLLRKKGEAIHPQRHTLEEWQMRRGELLAAGLEANWNAIYQQRPTDDAGSFFKREWIKLYKPSDLPKQLLHYMGTDFAIGEKRQAHYTAFPIAGRATNGHLYVREELYRERGSPGPQSVRELLRLYREYDVQMVAYDKTLIGHSLKGFMEEEADELDVEFNPWEFVPSRDKLTHAAALRAMLQAGKVWFPDVPITHEVWIPSLLSFGASTEDGDWDEIDGLAWMAIMLQEMTRPDEPKEPGDPRLKIEKKRRAEIRQRRRPVKPRNEHQLFRGRDE